MKKLALVLAVVLAAMLSAPNGALGEGEELRVDNDLAQCPDAPYTTIQAAVTVAVGMPGTQKIHICEGVYTENVLIGPGNPLQIFGDGVEKVTVRPAPSTAGPVFDIQDSGPVSIEKLTVDGLSAMVGGLVWGIRYEATAGAASGLVKDVVVRNIRDASGASQGSAVSIGSTPPTAIGPTVNVRVEDNLLENWTRVGIRANGIGASVHLEDNDIIGPVAPKVWAPNGIQVSRGAVGLVKGNTVRDATSPNPPAGAGSGILLFCAAPTTVEGNKVAHSDLGIALADNDGGGRIIGNEVRDSVFDAYSLQFIGNIFGPLNCPATPSPTTDNLLEGNKAFTSGENGVSLANFDPLNPLPPTNNRIINSDIKISGIDGIRAFQGSVGNFFINNQIEGSVEHDAHDDNPPAANTWEDNDCNSPAQQNQAGLCKDAP